jgi:hypothetical protein
MESVRADAICRKIANGRVPRLVDDWFHAAVGELSPMADQWPGRRSAARAVTGSTLGMCFALLRLSLPSACSPTDRAAAGGRGEAGHPAQDPRCAPGHYRYGAVGAVHRGPRSGGGR